MAISLTSLGEVARQDGDTAGATTLLEDGLALFREIGDQERVAWALHTLGRVAEDQKDMTGAVAYFAESLALRREQEHLHGMAASLSGLARVAATEGAPERAVLLLAAAAAARDASGVAVEPDEHDDDDRLLAMARTDLSQQAFATAWEAGRALPIEQVVTEALERAAATSRFSASPPPNVLFDRQIGCHTRSHAPFDSVQGGPNSE
jgi:tetratricopeptide (TPR) repeat protein